MLYSCIATCTARAQRKVIWLDVIMYFSFNVNPGFAQIVGNFQSKVKKQEIFLKTM